MKLPCEIACAQCNLGLSMSFEHWKLLIGTTAALCSTMTLLPQLLKMRRCGARDLSYQMLYLYLVGVLLWLLYGMMMHSIPIMISNASGTCLAVACISTKWKSEKTDRYYSPNKRSFWRC
jgi:MtN3 and saliva related transmembrane protein